MYMEKKSGLLRGVLTLPTTDPQERRNMFWVVIATICSGAGATLYGGELWSAFLAKTEFSTFQIGLMGSATTLSGAFGLLAFMGLADRIRRRVRTYVWCVALSAAVPLITAVLAFIPRDIFPLGGLLAALIGVGICSSLILSIPTMLDYPIWARCFTVGIRGRVFATVTTSYFLLTFILGLAIARVLENVPYPTGYAGCFVFAAVAILLRVATYSRLRELPDLAVAGASRSALPFKAIIDVLKMKEFQWLGPPHILRGLCSGLGGLTMVMAIKHLNVPDYFAGYATSVMALGNILAGMAIWLVADRWGAGRTTLVADIVSGAGMGLVMLSGSPVIFLLPYFLLQFGAAVEGSSVPLGCINIVPPERLGEFSSARLMVLTGAGAIGSALFGQLFMTFNPATVFAVGALLKVINGVWFWYVFGLKKPVDLAAAAHHPSATPQTPADT
jgi:MFS family permease